MRKYADTLRWDVVVQARNGFYWATAFVVALMGVLLASVSATVRDYPAEWVPALLVMNLQMTTFFFAAGLVLLEKSEGTLNALAVSPLSPAAYLTARTISLTMLGTVETIALVLIGFGAGGSWLAILSGAAALGVIYTASGAAVAARYESVNEFLLPATVFATVLLLPLLGEAGLASRSLFFWHPVGPPLALIRAGYTAPQASELLFGIVGSAVWSALAFLWGRQRVGALMRDTRAAGGR